MFHKTANKSADLTAVTIQISPTVIDIDKLLDELRSEKNVLSVESLEMGQFYSLLTSLKSSDIPAFISNLKGKYPLLEAYHDKLEPIRYLSP
jgi:hypothetical protein